MDSLDFAFIIQWGGNFSRNSPLNYQFAGASRSGILNPYFPDFFDEQKIPTAEASGAISPRDNVFFQDTQA